jgi:hypothetical protein
VDTYQISTSLVAIGIALVQNLQPFWQRKINLVLTLSLNFKGQHAVLHSVLFRKNAT